MSLQQRFSHALLDPEPMLPANLIGDEGRDPATRFAVYRNNVLRALTEALSATFPVTEALVGTEFFHAIACEFAQTQPPQSPVMAYYGADFSDFIHHFPAAASLPYLADLAMLEYRYVQAFHAADAPPLEIEALQHALGAIDNLPRLRLCLHPSVQLLRSAYAVVSLWAAHQHTDTAARLRRLDTGCAEQALILRRNLQVWVIPLNPADYRFTELLARGSHLGEALEQCQVQYPGFDAGPILALLTHQGALSALTTTTTGEIDHDCHD